MSHYRVEFDWVTTQRSFINVEASNETDAVKKVDDILRNKNNRDYEDPHDWLPEDESPFLDIKKVDVIEKEKKSD